VRVELWAWDGQTYGITSQRPDLIGEWFADTARQLMTADSRCEIRIRIWPQTKQEFEAVGNTAEIPFTRPGLQALADRIATVAQLAPDPDEETGP
jgi:hypothetical protein